MSRRERAGMGLYLLGVALFVGTAAYYGGLTRALPAAPWLMSCGIGLMLAGAWLFFSSNRHTLY